MFAEFRGRPAGDLGARMRGRGLGGPLGDVARLRHGE